MEVTGAGIVEVPPKTERGRRTLPLDDAMVTALRSLRTQQSRERLAAGTAYSSSCGDCGGEHLVVNELGHTYRPNGSAMSSGEWPRTRVAGDPASRCSAHLRHADAPSRSTHSRHLQVAGTCHSLSPWPPTSPPGRALTAAGALYGSVIRASQSGV